MKKLLSFLLVFAVFIVAVACAPVFAVDTLPAHLPGSVASAPSAFAAFLQTTVFPVLSALVLGVFTLFMNRLGEKYKIQSLSDRNAFVFKLAAQGVALAEEQAAKLIGSKSALTGNEKLDIAVAHVLAYAPKISQSQAQNIVHSVLAQIPGAGASGEAVTLLPQEGGYSIPVPSADELFAGAKTTEMTVEAPKPPARD